MYTRRKHTVFVFLIISLIVILPALPTAAATPTMSVVSMASADILKGNPGAARKAALDQALADAVSRAMIHLFTEAALVEHFAALSAAVVDQHDTFVRDYKVLAERQHGKTYLIMVKANILADQIRQQLKLTDSAASDAAKPAILLLVSQQDNASAPLQYWWAAGAGAFQPIINKFLKPVIEQHGFIVIDQQSEKAIEAAGAFAHQNQLNTDSALAFARQAGARIVIFGSARAQGATTGMGSDLKSFESQIQLTALDCETGQILSAIEDAAIAVSSDAAIGNAEALESASRSAAPAIVRDLKRKWDAQKTEDQVIKLIVQGSSNLAYFAGFRKILRNLEGVKEVQIQEIIADEAILGIDYDGNAQQLANELMRAKYDRFGIDLHEVFDDRIGLVLVAQ